MKTFSVQSIVKPYRGKERYETVSFRIDEEGTLWYLDKYRPPEKVESLQMVNRKRLISDKWDRRVKMVLSEKTIWVTKHRAQFFGIIPRDPQKEPKVSAKINKIDAPPKRSVTIMMEVKHYAAIKKKAEKQGVSVAQYIIGRLPKQ